MSDGALFKPDKDFSKDADTILPEAESLAKVLRNVLNSAMNLTSE